MCESVCVSPGSGSGGEAARAGGSLFPRSRRTDMKGTNTIDEVSEDVCEASFVFQSLEQQNRDPPVPLHFLW